MLRIENITKSYDQLQVLKGVSLQIMAGDIVSLVGKSGAGKSTLLHIAGTLDKPDTGKVLLQDKDVTKLSNRKISDFRNQHIGFIFQFHHLLPEFTALENVMIPGLIGRRASSEVKSEALSLLDVVGLTQRKDHKPGELSGGEQQRVAVARALINKPDIIFADEPSGNLDLTSSDEIHKLFFDLNDEFGQTFFIVTHNEALANLCHRKVEIIDGKINTE